MRQLSMKPANIKRRMSRLATDSVGWLVEKRCLLLATGVDAVIKRDARMIVRARKGNGYARNFCKRVPTRHASQGK